MGARKRTSEPRNLGTPEPRNLGPLVIERPVAGGRMLARKGGCVVFVAGAVPGETVRARIERSKGNVCWAETIDVLVPSPDRRPVKGDPLCGGALYAHITPDRQRQLKAEVIADAFHRIGKIDLPSPPAVASSPEEGYRLRARLHVRGRRIGFFREGSHAICDAGATGQLDPHTIRAVESLSRLLTDRLQDIDSVVVAENVAGTERVLHLVPIDGRRVDDLKGRLDRLDEVTGVTSSVSGPLTTLMGRPAVADTAVDLFGEAPPIAASTRWSRTAASFFQANRFLLGGLVRAVLETATGDCCLDLYAGVGLFAVALAARGSRVVAVEGDPVSAADLSQNAAIWRDHVRVFGASVEEIVARHDLPAPETVIVDPPRSGVSVAALDGVIRWQAPRVVYVSCDPPTLARDAARLSAAGYQLRTLEAFDLFPNTPHVECVALFGR